MDKNSCIKLLQKLNDPELNLNKSTMMHLFNLPQKYANKVLNLSNSQIMNISDVNQKKLELILDKLEIVDKFKEDFKKNYIFSIIYRIASSSFSKKDKRFLFKKGIEYISLCKEEWQAKDHNDIFYALINKKDKKILSLSADINNCKDIWQGDLIIRLLHNIDKMCIRDIIKSSKIILKCNNPWQYYHIGCSCSNEILIKEKMLPDFIRLMSECKEDWQANYIDRISWEDNLFEISWEDNLLIPPKFLKIANLFLEFSSEYSANILYNRIKDKYSKKNEDKTKIDEIRCLNILNELPDDADVNFDDIVIFDKINENENVTSNDIKVFQKFNRL